MKKIKSIEFNLKEMKKTNSCEYSTTIEKSWFDDCEADYYKIISAYSHFLFKFKNSSVLMKINFNFTVEHMCSRCGEKFKQTITEDIYEEYDSDDIIDVFPLLRECFIINQPIKILCDKCKN